MKVPRVIWVLGVAALCFGAGLWLGALRADATARANGAGTKDSGRATKPDSHAPTVPDSATARPVAERSLADLLRERCSGPSTQPLRRDLRARIAQLSLAEVTTLVEQTLKQPANMERAWWLEALGARWGELDPAGALRWIKTSSVEDAYILRGAVVQSWAKTDPAGLAREYAATRETWTQFGVLQTLLSEWTPKDPAAVRAWLGQLTSNAMRVEATSEFVKNWAKTDPRAALEFARGGATTRWGERAIGTVLGELARVDPAGAIQEFEKLPSGAARDRAAGQLASALAESEPKLAGELALVMPAGGARTEAITEVARKLGKKDPLAAFAWLDGQVTDPVVRGAAAQRVVSELAERDPALASGQLDRLPANNRIQLAGQVANNWAQQDSEAALTWVRGLAPGAARDSATAGALSIIAERDFNAGLELLRTEFAQSSDPRIASSVTGAIAWNDPDRLVASVQTLPAGGMRDAYVGAIVSQLGNRRPAEMAKLWETLPPGTARNSAAFALASTWSRRDPAAAARWSINLPDTPERAGTLEEIAKQWLDTDGGAARAWLEGVPLPIEVKQRLLKPRS